MLWCRSPQADGQSMPRRNRYSHALPAPHPRLRRLGRPGELDASAHGLGERRRGGLQLLGVPDADAVHVSQARRRAEHVEIDDCQRPGREVAALPDPVRVEHGLPAVEADEHHVGVADRLDPPPAADRPPEHLEMSVVAVPAVQQGQPAPGHSELPGQRLEDRARRGGAADDHAPATAGPVEPDRGRDPGHGGVAVARGEAAPLGLIAQTALVPCDLVQQVIGQRSRRAGPGGQTMGRLELLEDLALAGQPAVEADGGSQEIVPGVGAAQDVDPGACPGAVGAGQLTADQGDDVGPFGLVHRGLQPSVELEAPARIPEPRLPDALILAHGAQDLRNVTLPLLDLSERVRVGRGHDRALAGPQASAERHAHHDQGIYRRLGAVELGATGPRCGHQAGGSLAERDRMSAVEHEVAKRRQERLVCIQARARKRLYSGRLDLGAIRREAQRAQEGDLLAGSRQVRQRLGHRRPKPSG
jgi:hypothetical protein